MENINMTKLRRSLFDIPASKKVSRSLFGEVDHEEIKNDMQREFREIILAKKKLWNFDFEKNIPRDKENGLQWVSCPSKVAEFTIKSGVSLVSSFLIRETSSKGDIATEDRSVNLSREESLPADLKTRLQPEDKTTELGEEENIIRIVNASPPRPRLLKDEISASNNQPAVAHTTQSYSRKRKRGDQQKIDDFMKKKKPRVSMDISKMLRKEVTPVSTRLRSSPIAQIPV